MLVPISERQNITTSTLADFNGTALMSHSTTPGPMATRSKLCTVFLIDLASLASPQPRSATTAESGRWRQADMITSRGSDGHAVACCWDPWWYAVKSEASFLNICMLCWLVWVYSCSFRYLNLEACSLSLA